jgi:sensor histidine kinase YesM
MQMKISWKRVGAHVLFWMAVFGIWYYLRYQDYSRPSTALKVTAIKVIDLAILVYITNRILLPKLLYKRRYTGFVLIFLTMIVASSVLKMQLLGWVLGNNFLELTGASLRQRVYDNLLPHFFLVAAGAAIQLVFDYQKLQVRMAQTAAEKARAELDFLKSQINPHFLFNSLNSVYFLIDKNNPEARNALHRFSEMLRYQLYEMNADQIPLEKEWRFLTDYFALQRLRQNEHYQFELSKNEWTGTMQIAPLLLMPFVENAFKHLSHHTDRINFVKLELNVTDEWLNFLVQNSCHPAGNEQAGGIGLQNVKRRLELLYPGQHDLKIESKEDRFSVLLRLRLNAAVGGMQMASRQILVSK